MNSLLPINFSRFEVEITDEIFISQRGFSCAQTALLTFFDAHNIYINTVKCGYLTKEKIYEDLKVHRKLNLDECYIPGFSISEYRELLGMGSNEFVEMYGISAEGAVFETDASVDFSYIRATEEGVNFKNARFTRGNLDLSNLIIEKGNFDFSDALVKGKKIDFSNIHIKKAKVSFKNTIFSEGAKDFQYANFESGKVEFVNTDFGKGDVSFINAHFGEGKVSFKLARFGTGEVDFHYSKFEGGELSFERVKFGSGNVNFKMIEFGESRVNFNRSEFLEGDKLFEGSSLKGKMTFKKSDLGKGKLDFELAEFKDSDLIFDKAHIEDVKMSFNQAAFKLISFTGCQINNYMNLRVLSCNVVDLSDTIVRDVIDLKPYKTEVDIKKINISGMFLLGVIYIEWNSNRVLDMIQAQSKTDYSQKADQFLILKENFNKSGRYNDEDQAYIWFKRFEAKDLLMKHMEHNALLRFYYIVIHWCKKIIFDYMGLYATNPMRVLVSTIITWALFGFAYAFSLLTNLGSINSGIGGEHDQIGVLGRSLYHSGITFFTIGYGDFYPLGAVRWLSNIEGFVGVFMMSYFTVAFVRKILR